MPLFDIPNRPKRENDALIARKSKSAVKAPTSRSGTLLDRISNITKMVDKHLGQYKDDYIIIRDFDTLSDYISASIENGVISIDTETTGLDPISDKIVGLCLYTPNNKPAYVPINHVSYVTGARVENQLAENNVASQLQRLVGVKTKVVMFNAKFDIRFIRNQLGVYLTCYWDAYLASRLMNENEEHKGLKALHKKYVLDGEGDAFSFDELFKGISFDKIPITTGYLYAAHDAIITYELYQYQKQYLYYDADEPNDARNGMNGVAWVFFNIEMPCVNVVCDMEDIGVKFDFEYQRTLSEKYNVLLNEKVAEFNELLDAYDDDIQRYLHKYPDAKLDNPINIGSPTQIAILLYDILNIEPPEPKNPRGTGEAILRKIDNPIAKAVLDYREFAKLVSTYIDKLPNCVNPKDGRIHCSFNQYGADTGRMSSSEPNLQNIPSHNKDIRKMFVASEGYVLMSSDFSQQEPKCLAALCKKQGDSQMYDTFMQGKDLYSEIASKAFNKPYEECREFDVNGNVNKQGKERRTQAKSILLGVLYGRGTASIGEQLRCTTEKAQAIKDSVFNGFPAIEQFEKSSLEMAEDLGYVTTVCGRKRRLPDLQLNEYEFQLKSGSTQNVDVLDFDSDDAEIPDRVIRRYLTRLHKAWGREKRKIFEDANKEGIWIVDNGGKIADAQRQCVNARIQGSAADLTKLAMIELNNSEELKKLGFRLLIPVHDEVIAECPEENVSECAKLLADTMSKAAEEILEMPIKCDVEITKEWYGEPIDGKEKKVGEANTARQFENELTQVNA